MRKITLGRLPNNDIVFTPMSVSRMHADLICNNGSYQLIDHSAAGTTVNGYPVHNSSMTVNKGDNILLAGQVPLDWSRVEQIEYGGAGGTQVVQVRTFLLSRNRTEWLLPVSYCRSSSRCWD